MAGAAPANVAVVSLKTYARKRDFSKTPEPAGRKAPHGKHLRFVIQKHHATRLHYDFRLEVDGVLASWAVPKGPSLLPADKRLAMHVEDHPMEYRTFEGVIPPGNYGAGEVIVWDEGTYTLAEGTDPAHEIAHGKIKFSLKGKKLHGLFSLVKIHRRNDEESGEPWLLIKDHDDYAITHAMPELDDVSARSGKTLASLKNDPGAAQWISGKKKSAVKRDPHPAHADPFPTITQPMLATLTDRPFDDDDWLFEIKWDGYRAICAVDKHGKLSLTSRNGLDFLPQFPELADLAQAFTSAPIIVDGEIVSLDAAGRSSFQRLQGSFNRRRPSARNTAADAGPLTFAAFDLLYAEGRDLRKEPLEERKALLERSIADEALVLYSKHIVGRGTALFEQARKKHLEGIIAKKRRSPYQMRRSRDWLKIKIAHAIECVIGGYTEPRGSRKGFGALILGLYDGKQLHYVGHVGTGFDTKTLAQMSKHLRTLEVERSPFAGDVPANAPTHWVKPTLVAEVRYGEWTRDGILRHPVFLGLRVDKDAKSVTRDVVVKHQEVV